MKTAEMSIRVLEFVCPDCKEHLSAPDGSHMFDLCSDPLPDSVVCDCCQKAVKLPARAKKLQEAK